jgi:CRP-like cAMP-binding protein
MSRLSRRLCSDAATLATNQAEVLVIADRIRNRVLRQLAQADREVYVELMNELEPHPMERGTWLSAPRSVAEFIYFVDSGVVSLLATTRNGNSVEVGLVGREGVAGISEALGTLPLPYGLVVQLSGLTYRAPKQVIRQHILSCSALHTLLMDYSQLVMHQLAQSALCNRFHSSVQRLARWLLLTAERADTHRFELTHEFVAQMIGVPRSAVSESASTLRDRGAIDYRRGVLAIRNLKRLHKAACECFDMVSPIVDAGMTVAAEPRESRRAGRRRA